MRILGDKWGRMKNTHQNLSADSMRRYTAEHLNIIKHIAAGDAQAAAHASAPPSPP